MSATPSLKHFTHISSFRAFKLSLIAMVGTTLIACSQPRPQAEHPVFAAVMDNDVTITNQFLAEGGDPNLTNSRGDPLLYVASGARGGTEVAEMLIVGGANVNLANAAGRTPLHNAAGWCNASIVALLMENNADVRAVDGQGTSVIDAVCATPEERRQDVLALLFE